MSIHLYKIQALFKKDIRDTLKNGNSLLLGVLPVLFTVLYRSMSFGGESMDPAFVMTLGLLMSLSMMPISMMAMMIAEEKEKNTLRTLMLSNVSAVEFLVSKALVLFVLTQAVNLIIYYVTASGAGFAAFFGVTSLGCLCLMFFGALIGILSRNQMSTGMLSAPLMLLMLLPSVFAQVDEGIAKFARFVPTTAIISLLSGAENAAFHIAVLLGWTVLAGALFTVVYRRKRLD